MAKTFTQLFASLVPSWLSAGDGGKVLHSLAVVKDKLVRRARLGLNARFPRRAGPSALELIGADRGILRGRFETDARYAERLTKWRYPKQHRVRGGAFALLDQIAEYVNGAVTYTLDKRGNFYVRGLSSLGGAYARDAEIYVHGFPITSIAWDALDPVVHWARFYVTLCANPELPWITATPAFGDSELWGGAVGTPGYCVGLSGWTPTDTANIRKLFRGGQQWKPHGTRAEWLQVQLTNWTFAPSPAVDATWERWASIVGGVRTPARSADFRYLSLSPEVNNIFEGDPTQWADEAVMLGGAPNHAGNPATFSASTTLPDGTSYGGNPARFPTRIQLVDDGDQT
jgi:hypothetical protein